MSTGAKAQVNISGRVMLENKKPVAGASVSIKDSYDGGTTDSAGNFNFQSAETGKQVLIVSFIGYEDLTDTIFIAGNPVNLTLTIHPKPTALDAVVITAGTFAAGDAQKSTELSALDIVTTANSNADITSAIKTLPGAQQVGESEGLFVRGGTSDESKIYIDGTLVNNFFYTSNPEKATRGRFNPFLFKGTIFSSGGYSALYGQALSAVLLLESLDLPEKTSASLGASYLGFNGGIQKLAKNKKSSYGLTYAYTNLALAYGLSKQEMDNFKIPQLNELDGNFRMKTHSGGMIKYYGYLNFLGLGYRFPDIDSAGLKDAFSIRNVNTYHNLSWKEKLGDGWKMQLGASYSINSDKIGNQLQNQMNQPVPFLNNSVLDQKSFDLRNKGQYINGRWTLEKKWSAQSAIRLGNEYNYSNESVKFYDSKGQLYPRILKEQLIATYAEGDFYILPNFPLRAGVRSEHSQLFNSWNIAPRVSLAYQFKDKGQFSLAYGIFYENPSSKYVGNAGLLHFERADHYILQYQKMANRRIFRTEIYYKKYKDLLKADEVNGKLTAINNDGFGDAKGIEFFFRDKKSIRNVDYWISYTYLDTKRNFLNYPYLIRPPFSSRHTASLVIKKFFVPIKTQLNLSYTFASGRPYYDIYQSGAPNQFAIRQQGLTRDYNDLSLSLNYVPSVGKKDAKSFGVWVFSVTNLPGFNNIYTYNFSADGTRKFPVLPSSKRFFYLGYFVSIGIDRTQDEIENHL